MENLIQIKNLKKLYTGKAVLNGINMNVCRGDIYGLIGPNGAGKTTTIKCILGLIIPTDGIITVEGKAVSRYEVNEHSFGVVLDNFGFYDNLTGEDNLKMVGRLVGVSDNTIKANMDRFGLNNVGKKHVGKYSLGMKQRLALARAFLTNPNVVILDEPTNGLDPEGIIEIRNMITKCSQDLGTTFIYCSHLLSEVENLCNRVGIINNGQIVKEGEINTLLNNSSDKYIIESKHICQLKELFTKMDILVENANESSIVVVINKGDFHKVNVSLVASGIKFDSIHQEKLTLESYFLGEVHKC